MCQIVHSRDRPTILVSYRALLCRAERSVKSIRYVKYVRGIEKSQKYFKNHIYAEDDHTDDKRGQARRTRVS